MSITYINVDPYINVHHLYKCRSLTMYYLNDKQYNYNAYKACDVTGLGTW